MCVIPAQLTRKTRHSALNWVTLVTHYTALLLLGWWLSRHFSPHHNRTESRNGEAGDEKLWQVSNQASNPAGNRKQLISHSRCHITGRKNFLSGLCFPPMWVCVSYFFSLAFANSSFINSCVHLWQPLSWSSSSSSECRPDFHSLILDSELGVVVVGQRDFAAGLEKEDEGRYVLAKRERMFACNIPALKRDVWRELNSW